MAPTITDTPPDGVREDLDGLSSYLTDALPARRLDQNLLIATWNIRGFGDVTKKWASDDDDSPKRDFHAVAAIAEVISRFDVVALQEVKGNIRGLRYVMKLLGHDWSFLMSDVTRGAKGNGERLAFVFDTRRVALSGLAAELVVSPELLAADVAEGAMQRQFARTPYAVGFRSGAQTFVLTTAHVIFGEPEDRVPELTALAEWMADWSRRTKEWGQNFMLLGDFNIDREGDELYRAFTSTGLHVPGDLHGVPRTIFDDPADPADKFYDQIAWFKDGAGGDQLTLSFARAGGLDLWGRVLTHEEGWTKRSWSWRISDHLPLWCEFEL